MTVHVGGDYAEADAHRTKVITATSWFSFTLFEQFGTTGAVGSRFVVSCTTC